MKVSKFEMRIVHRVPEILEPGVLYVCFDCNVVIHLCACGCAEKVVLPIDPDFWSIHYDGETVSLSPSIGNFRFACQSHYWLKKNQVIWAEPHHEAEAERKPQKKKFNIRAFLKSLFVFVRNLF